MNIVSIMGKLTKDPEVRVSSTSQSSVARFSVAINRGKKDGKDLGADFPNCVAFGKTAEFIEKYFHKGDSIALNGHIQTGSYEKDGHKVYATDVIADKVFFCGGKANGESKQASASADVPSDIPQGFSQLNDDDIPF